MQNYDIYWCYKYFSQINTDQYRNKFKKEQKKQQTDRQTTK